MNLRISKCGFRNFPPPSRKREEGRELEIRNPKSVIFLVSIFLLSALFYSAPAAAKLAVFVDGRVLKVDDARLEGSDIVLDLKGGGTLRVTAVRIDRVIADEVEESASDGSFSDPDCPVSWTDIELPEKLPFRELIASAARAVNLDPWLVATVVQTESAFDPYAISRAGASGLMQLMPSAALEHAVDDVFDPADNLRGGAEHLRLMLDRFDSLPLALAAYNAGASSVTRYNGIPPYKETRDYVRKVLALFCPEE